MIGVATDISLQKLYADWQYSWFRLCANSVKILLCFYSNIVLIMLQNEKQLKSGAKTRSTV